MRSCTAQSASRRHSASSKSWPDRSGVTRRRCFGRWSISRRAAASGTRIYSATPPNAAPRSSSATGHRGALIETPTWARRSGTKLRSERHCTR
ncbi:hypothetical protein V2I01_37545 [Micromonospora sp. BRA006-A]|nr:hypothetical protein [Micromonospora sp. BRA006-A]